MTTWTPYDSLSSQEITVIARCAARDPYYLPISPAGDDMGYPRGQLHYLIFQRAVSRVIGNLLFRAHRRSVVRRLTRAHDGAPYAWQELVSELRRRDDLHKGS